jgi:autotransporter-associated beta strand protein
MRNGNRKARRLLALSTAVAAAWGQIRPAIAANTVSTYTGGATISSPADGQDWNTAGNWIPGGVPASSSALELDFNDSGTNAYSTLDDLGALTLNEIQFNSGSSGTITLNASGPSSLSFAVNGTVNPTIWQNGIGAVVMNVPMSVAAAANPLTFSGLENPAGAGTSNGNLSINGSISGTGGVVAFGGSNTVSSLATSVGTNGGYGTITLSGANTYTGGTFLNAGGLTLDFTTDTVGTGATNRISN